MTGLHHHHGENNNPYIGNLPAFVAHENREEHTKSYRDEETISDKINRFWWPVAAVLIIIFNCLFCIASLYPMYVNSTYSVLNNFGAMAIFAMSMGVLIVAHHYCVDVNYDDRRDG